MSSFKKIAITTGDTNGIGLEVAAKALRKIGPVKNVCFLLYTESKPKLNLKKIIPSIFRPVYFNSAKDAFNFLNHSFSFLVVIQSKDRPAMWVEQSVRLAMKKKIDALVTGPISKKETFALGHNDLGHTDILKRLSGERNLFMCFVGKKFNVALATGHVPISKVSSGLKSQEICRLILLLDNFYRRLHSKTKPIGLVGLNPHAGDSGLIGNEENQILDFALRQLPKGVRVLGPLVPDVAFQKENWKKFSFYLSCYHDQGLIPFKLIHGFNSGVHITLGLPFIRTSVDHGTAFDLFGKNKANPGSMKEALLLATRLIKS